jgi:benzoyl-CoA reductase/2-hydroxyglutaryl-CoA dehydratase subunit BcrC/BadD/HgdB
MRQAVFEKEKTMDIHETFSRMKKLGLIVPPMSTKEEQEELNKFAEKIRNDFQKSLPEIVDVLENDPVHNTNLSKSLQEGIKRTWNMP